MSTPPIDAEVRRGAAVYTPLALASYDTVVLGLACTVTLRCPQRHLVDLYRRNMAGHHLDVGVGTGRLIARAAPDPDTTTITLADINQACLAKAARTLRAYRPVTVTANALETLPFDPGTFDSAAASFLLHCVPGTITEKAVVLTHMAATLRPGGRLFGSTILARGVSHTRAARRLIAANNRKGIFHNADDSLTDLDAVLAKLTPHYTLSTRGCVALFACALP
jgi:ubiquinone/menaquinone biosynthesis C-methylase UbiE